MKGNLIIISAPSGTGKTTILKKIMPRLQGLTFSVSHTTRSPRLGEEQGKDYQFVSKDAFLALRDQGGFLEWAKVHDNYYGTSKKEVTDRLNQGIDVFLDIDIQGARQVRKAAPDAISIFICPPSWQEQEKRLTGRGTDSPETIALRLKNAKAEMADVDNYDYVVINDDLDSAARMLEAIILAMRAKNRRHLSGAPLCLPTEHS
jgi:guanylate kinase